MWLLLTKQLACLKLAIFNNTLKYMEVFIVVGRLCFLGALFYWALRERLKGGTSEILWCCTVMVRHFGAQEE